MSEPQPAPSASPSAFLRLAGMQEAGLLGVILVLGLLLTLLGGSVEQRVTDPATGEQYIVVKNKFLNVDRLLKLAKDTSFFAVMAVGATLVIVAGGIDLSVGGIYVLAGLAGAALLRTCGPEGAWSGIDGWPVVALAVPLCLAVGACCGLVNGLGVVGLRLHPFIITLGTMSIFRGLAFVSTGGETIGRFDAAFVDGFIGRRIALGPGEFIYPVPLCVLLLVAAWGTYYLSTTVAGRKLYALGGNELAARYSGLPVERLKTTAYVLAGLTAGVAAAINIGYHGAASPGDGQGYELDVIAAAVVGGASLSGGRGTALGAVLGALVIRMIDTGIVILELDQQYSRIIVGAVIVAAAALDRWQALWRGRAAG